MNLARGSKHPGAGVGDVVFREAAVARPPHVDRQMRTRSELIEIAKSAAEEEGWPWQEPVKVMKNRRWFLIGALQWEVMTAAEYRGGNLYIMIDDKTGKVIGKSFYPY